MATFTFDTAAAVQAPGPVQSGPALIGTAGQGSQPRASYAPGGEFAAVADSASRTIDALVKMGQTLLAPKVQAEKSRMAMEGMVAGLQGMSAAQIQDEEIFGGMFGDTVTVAAARQVEQMDAVNKFNIHLSENMHELQKMDSMQFRQWFPQQMQQFMTGDEVSDGMITQAFMESAPKVIDMHTKAHIGYRQQVAEQAWSNDLQTAGAGMSLARVKAASGQLNPEFALQAQQQFVARLAGPGGIHGEAYKSWLNKAYRQFAADGNIEALDLMEQTGILDATQTGEQYEQLVKIRDRSESKLMAEAPAFARYGRDLGVMESALANGYSGFASVDSLVEWAAGYNKSSAAETGVDKPVIDNRRLESMVEKYLGGLEKMKDKSTRFDPDQAAVVAAGLYKQGAYHLVYADPDMNKSEVKNKVHQLLLQDTSIAPSDLARMVAHSEEDWQPIKGVLKPAVDFLRTGKGTPQAMHGALGFLHQMATEGGTAAASLLGRYMPAEVAGEAMNMIEQLGDKFNDPETFARYAETYGVNKYPPPTINQVSEAEAWIKESTGSWFGFGNDDLNAVGLTERGKELLAGILAPNAARAYRTGRSYEQAAQIAMGDILHKTDFVGGVPIVSHAGSNEPNKTLHAAFNAKLAAVAKANNISTFQPVSPYSKEFQSAVKLALDAKLPAVQTADKLSMPWANSTVINGYWVGGQRGAMTLAVENEAGEEVSLLLTVDDVLDAYTTMRNDPNRYRTDTFKPKQSLPGRPYHTQ